MKDPVRFCEVYRKEGCAHVDGYLCDYETCEIRRNYMIKYSEQWDAYYDESTNEWTESKCTDPTCPYCVGRPERPFTINQDPDIIQS